MRTLAIGDIHGCITALKTLLAVIQPQPEDTVVTLGDYVDRGPDTRGVLDTLIALEKRTQLKPLMGNHEILFLEAISGRMDGEGWLQVGGRETMRSYTPDGKIDRKVVPQEHLAFLTTRCLRHWETPTHVFVHANANAVLPMDEQTDDWLFWTRFEEAYPLTSGKTMVCGHTAQKSGLPAFHERAICIDTWAYGGQWLTCLDVDSGEMVQCNQAGETRYLTSKGQVK